MILAFTLPLGSISPKSIGYAWEKHKEINIHKILRTCKIFNKSILLKKHFSKNIAAFHLQCKILINMRFYYKLQKTNQ